MAGMELPLRAIREQIGSAIHLIVHESRFSDGTRKISRISELVGLEGDQITMQDLFVYEQTGIDENNRVLGHFTATGSVPTFLEDLRVRGIRLRQSVFEPGATVS
jgi:pilus assembly protein CpaF